MLRENQSANSSHLQKRVLRWWRRKKKKKVGVGVWVCADDIKHRDGLDVEVQNGSGGPDLLGRTTQEVTLGMRLWV